MKLLTENSLKIVLSIVFSWIIQKYRIQCFNDFFSNIAGNINSSNPKTSALPESYLQNYPDINFEFGFCSTEKSLKLLNHLKIKKIVDIDNLSSNLLKTVALEISASLSNKSLKSGVVK